MSTLSVTLSEANAQRYEALLRAANAIGTCSDCDTAADVLVKTLLEVVPFDYLELVAFENDTTTVAWHLLYSNGARQSSRLTDVAVDGTPVEWVRDSQRALVTPDWSEETRFAKHGEYLTRLGIASTCMLPLARGPRRLGVLSIGSSRPDAYPEDEVGFLSLMADQIALAIDAAVNFYLSRQAQDRLKLILDLTNQVVAKLNFQDLLRTISASVRRVMRCDAAAIMLPEPDGVHLRVHALDFPDRKGFFTEDILIPIEDSMPAETFRSGKPWIVNRLGPAEVSPEMYAKAAGEGMNSFCDVALISLDRSLGVLALASREENAFDGEAAAFLSQVAQQVAIGLENALAFGEIADLKDKLAQEKLYLEDEIRGEMDFEGIVGQSSALRHVLNLVETVAPSDSTVLLLGETGTGKELVARAIHDCSRRKGRTLVRLNCAAIPTGLLESELFGHEKGAFTGAISQKIGRLELADQGTLFLDEVGDIPIEIQPKLLRVLQEREFERLGSIHTRRVNIRLVAATNRDLEEMIAAREFRTDLYYRLHVFPIRIPPLRERKEDIPPLVSYFVQKFAKQMQKKIEAISPAVMKGLTAWEWPGNIRELENFIERAVIVTRGKSLEAPLGELRRSKAQEPAVTMQGSGQEDIARIVKETLHVLNGNKTAAEERAQKQREEIVRALGESKGRVGGADGAAARMGINRTTLLSRMKKFGIEPGQHA